VVTMNTQTELRVRTRASVATFISSGRGYVAVMHDPKRPFAVRVGEWTAVALGTLLPSAGWMS